MASSSTLCEMCDKPGPHRCANCSQSSYCSQSCQKADWTKHKHLCRQLPNFPASSRPPPTGPTSVFRRAVYFDPSKDHPAFVWLELRKEDLGGALYELPVLDELISKKKTEQAIEYIQMNPRTKRDMARVIYVRYRDNFYNDGSKRNEGIRKAIDPALRSVRREWRGPMVFYGMEDVDYAPEVPSVDLDASDMRHIVDWLHSKR